MLEAPVFFTAAAPQNKKRTDPETEATRSHDGATGTGGWGGCISAEVHTSS